MTFVLNGRAAQPFKGSPGLPKFTAIFNTHIQLRYKFRHTVARAAPSSRSREPERRNYRRRHVSVNVIDSTVTYKLKNQKKVVDAKAKFSEMFSLGLLLSAFTIASVTAFGSVPVSGPSRFTAAINV